MSALRMGKRKSTSGSGSAQKSLSGFDFTTYPQIKLPVKLVGTEIGVPGDFWDKCPAADKDKIFKCVIRDHSIAHRFAVGPMSPAYQLQEMGERGSGSLEQGDSSGEVFWMQYGSYVLCVLAVP